jgi:hypothetical protein
MRSPSVFGGMDALPGHGCRLRLVGAEDVRDRRPSSEILHEIVVTLREIARMCGTPGGVSPASAGASLRDLHKFARHVRVEDTVNLYDLPEPAELRAVAELMPDVRPNGGKKIGRGAKAVLDRAEGKGHHVSVTCSREHMKTAPTRTRPSDGTRPCRVLAGDTSTASFGRVPLVGREEAERANGAGGNRPYGSDARSEFERVIRCHERFLDLARLRFAREGAGDDHEQRDA